MMLKLTSVCPTSDDTWSAVQEKPPFPTHDEERTRDGPFDGLPPVEGDEGGGVACYFLPSIHKIDPVIVEDRLEAGSLPAAGFLGEEIEDVVAL